MADFKDIAAGIQSIVTSIGIVIAGGWALFSFWDLHTAQKARLDIAESEQRLIEKPVLEMEIKWDVFGRPNGPNKQVGARVIFKNDGKRGVSVDQMRLQIKSVDGTKAISIKPNKIDNNGASEEMSARVLRPGQSRSVAFITEPLPPRLYLVQASTIYSGFKIEGGAINPSNDEPIDALEQIVAIVPQ